MIIILLYENDINKGVGFGVRGFFTGMLDGWEKGEADGGCREFGLSVWTGLGGPWRDSTHLIVLGYFFLQPHSARGSLGKKSTHWNGREVNRWIIGDWELIDVRGNLTESVVRQPQTEQACARRLRFLWNCCIFRSALDLFIDLDFKSVSVNY